LKIFFRKAFPNRELLYVSGFLKKQLFCPKNCLLAKMNRLRTENWKKNRNTAFIEPKILYAAFLDMFLEI